jgi:hypothetical protein
MIQRPHESPVDLRCRHVGLVGHFVTIYTAERAMLESEAAVPDPRRGAGGTGTVVDEIGSLISHDDGEAMRLELVEVNNHLMG